MWEPFAGGRSAGNSRTFPNGRAFRSSRSFGECVPRQAVPTASGTTIFPQRQASGTTTFPPRQGIGKQQLFFDCAHFRAASQPLWELLTHGKHSEAVALSANEFPGRQYQRHRGQRPFPNGRASGITTFPPRQGIGDNDLSLTASSMEPFAGGRSAGNSRTFGGRASGAACFLRIFFCNFQKGY